MRYRNKRIFSGVLVIFLLLTLVSSTGVFTVSAKKITDISVSQLPLQELQKHLVESMSQKKITNSGVVGGGINNLPLKDPNESVRVIVEMEDKPVINDFRFYNKGIGTVSFGKEIENIIAKQESTKAKAVSITGGKLKHSYGLLVNGFSMEIKRGEMNKLNSLQGVKRVAEVKSYYPDMESAKKLTQAYDVWKNYGLKGEGMVISIIDTGIDPSHKDMRLDPTTVTKINSIKQSSSSTKFTLKVPYGYNFADNNDDIIDRTSSMHGMHVAGIAAANGIEEEATSLKAIRGVAPEAQLLAMKVFSNNSNDVVAYSDDIVAAIEDSVLHGADVINMSLGSPSGFQDPEDPEQVAITNAVNNGVVVVVSAGNSQYSTAPYKMAEAVDTGVVESPGVSKDAIQVASFENDIIVDERYNPHIAVANPKAKDMSSFSSWGPASNLEFKPDVTAPGGNIYSTVNGNQYEVMSGTSMSAPHVAGAEALLLQNIEGKLNLSGRQRVEFAKAVTINTAVPQMDKSHPGVPYSPRRQGSGLMQIENAVKANVTITDSRNMAAVSLKQIGKLTTYKLTIRNYGSQPVSYTIDTIGGALTEQNNYTDSMSYDVKIEGASISFDKSQIALAPGQTETVSVTVSLPDTFATEQFVEGFIRFTPSDSSPVLTSPFIGFYGDWSKPSLFDAPNWEEERTIFGQTGLATIINGEYYYAGDIVKGKYGNISLPNSIAISPENDGVNDVVMPALWLLRNTRDVTVRVLNERGQEIRNLSGALPNQMNLFKNIYSDEYLGYPQLLESGKWDGTLYNSLTGRYEKVVDGQYYIDIKGRADIEGAVEQELSMPVKVDTKAPQIQIKSSPNVSSGNYRLEFTVVDELSGLSSSVQPIVMVNGQIVKEITLTREGNNYSGNVSLPVGTSNLQVAAKDNAANIAVTANYPVSVDITRPYTLTTTQTIGISDSLIIKMNETIRPAADFVNISVKDNRGREIAVQGSHSLDQIMLRPYSTLEYGNTYTVSIPSNAVADSAGNNLGQNIEVIFNTNNQNRSEYYRLYGINRYETAAQISQSGWTSAQNAVLVTGEDYADALAAAPFAKMIGAPILLTDPNELSPVTEGEIRRLGIKKVYIVGGVGAVSKKIEDTLIQKYSIDTIRYSGLTRYETAIEVAKQIRADGRAIIATGDNFPDALSIASYAASNTIPILLVQKDFVPEVVSGYMRNYGINKTFVVGGEGVISSGVEMKLPAPERLWGQNRYDTNTQILRRLNSGYNFDTVYIATGEDFPDALAGSVAASLSNSPIILVSEYMGDSTLNLLRDKLPGVRVKYVLGGSGVVNQDILDRILK